MKAFKDYRGRILKWVRPKAIRRHYQLKSGDDLCAMLTWAKAYGSLAVGECADGKYSFKRGGFLHPFVTVRKQPFDTDYAKLQMDFSGNGVVQFIDGRSFQFQKLSFWRLDWGIIDSGGKVMFTTIDKMPALKETGEVRLEQDVRPSPHLSVLLLLT